MFDDFDLGLQCEEYYNEVEYNAMVEYRREEKQYSKR